MTCTKCHRSIQSFERYHRTEKGQHHRECPPLTKVYLNRDEQEIDEVACILHNTGSQLAGNTQEGDLLWFAERLYSSSNFGHGDVKTMEWSISNEEFEKLGLTPDRAWTNNRWKTLQQSERDAWIKLARLCLYALPHIAERIGHRFMEQSKALRILHSAEHKDLK